MAIQLKNDNVLISDINNLQEIVGGGSLTTTAQTLIGAINENKSTFANYLPLTGGTIINNLIIEGNTTCNKHIMAVGISTTDTSASNYYYNGGVEIRESNLVGNSQSDFAYAPRLGFHWGGRIAASLSFHTDGLFYLRKQNGTDRATLDANLQGSANTVDRWTRLSNGSLYNGSNEQHIQWTSSVTDNNTTGRSWYGIGRYENTSDSNYSWLNISNYWGINITTRGYAYLRSNNSAITCAASSSYKVKENISTMSNEKAKNLLNLDIIDFDYKKGYGNDQKDQSGVLVEQVLEKMPNVIINMEQYDKEKNTRQFCRVLVTRL